jgi:hypothetical protein
MPRPKPTGPRLIHLRIERDLVKRIDRVAVEHDLNRTDLIEMLLEVVMDKVDEDDPDWDIEDLVDEFFDEDDEDDEEDEDE